MQLINNAPLKDFVNYKIGGTTPRLYIIENLLDFKQIPVRDVFNAFILGSGTNVLVSDRGVSKAVLKIDIKDYSIDNNKIMTVGSGAILDEMAKYTANLGYKGLAHVSGIPGTVGGAIVMNASASNGAISDYLIDVEVIDRRTKERRTFLKDECGFSFRSSIFQNDNYIITHVRFQLEDGNRGELLKMHEDINSYRQKNYPLTFPSAGCWFKRDWGGRDIIEKIGMVGAIKGKAVVSPMFPSFILNTGNASSDDVYALVTEIQEKALAIGEVMPLEVLIWK